MMSSSLSTAGFWEERTTPFPVIEAASVHDPQVELALGSSAASVVGASEIAASHAGEPPHEVYALHDKPGQAVQRFNPRPGGPPPQRPNQPPHRDPRNDGGAVKKLPLKEKDANLFRYCRSCGSLHHNWNYCPYYQEQPPTEVQCPNCRAYHYGACKKEAISKARQQKEADDKAKRNRN